jgi:hypothetical protein
LAAKFEGIRRNDVLRYRIIEFVEIIEQALEERANEYGTGSKI